MKQSERKALPEVNPTRRAEDKTQMLRAEVFQLHVHQQRANEGFVGGDKSYGFLMKGWRKTAGCPNTKLPLRNESYSICDQINYLLHIIDKC